MKPEAVNLYLKANGIDVIGSTDDYYRLSGDSIKAWTNIAPEPSLDELAAYEKQLKDIEEIEKPKREAKEKLRETDGSLGRVLEDVISILKTKHGIDLEEEFSPKAKEKLKERRDARAAFGKE